MVTLMGRIECSGLISRLKKLVSKMQTPLSFLLCSAAHTEPVDRCLWNFGTKADYLEKSIIIKGYLWVKVVEYISPLSRNQKYVIIIAFL